MTSHWELKKFNIRFPRWRDFDWRTLEQPEPPVDLAKRVDLWWRGLEFSSGRPRADRVSPDRDPEGNLWWTWIPNTYWKDRSEHWFRVACYFRVLESEDPRQIVCDRFETHEATPPAGSS